MLVCKKCGLELLDDEQVCPNCGTPVGQGAENSAQPEQPQYPQMKDPRSEYTAGGKDWTAEFSPDDIAQNQALAIIGYIIPLVSIIAGLAGTSKFLKFHANQALMLILAGILLSFIILIPVLGIMLSIVGIVIQIMGLVFACQGKAKQLPLIGGITIIKWY